MTRQFSTLLFVLAAGCAADVASPTPPQPETHADHTRLQTLEPAAQAVFRQDEPFRQVGLLIDTPATDLEGRVDGGPWRSFEVTWTEGAHKVARLLLDEPAQHLELRATEPWTFGTIQFYDEVAAGARLTRDLPVTSPEAAPNGLAPASLVISRANWGARDPNKVCGDPHDPYRMAIHHTASPADDGGDAAARMRQMQAYHIDSNGWCDIGYHFVVSQAGQVYQGRSDEARTGAHVGNQNTGNIGICLIGNFEAQQVNDTQFAKAAEIVGWVGRTYDIPFTRTAVKGHREHDGQSTACPGTNLLNRLEELVAAAAGEPQPPATPSPVAFEVNWLGETADFYQSGTSAGKPDFFPGDTLQAEIRFKNTTSGPLRNVSLGYWFEAPHLAASNYVIETDSPAGDGATFVVNDSDANPDNPAKNAMGAEGALGLYAFGAGETKRVVVDLTAGAYSIGLADHPDVRGWVRHIDDQYGEQSAFDEDPTNANAFEGLLQAYAELDVLSRHEWQFDGPDAAEVEGWSGCAGVAPAVDVAAGALVADFAAEGCVDAPAWTSIDATTWDQLVVRMTVSEATHAAIYWAVEGEDLASERAVSFAVVPGNSTYVVPVGTHAGWSGEVTRLRIVPTLDVAMRVPVDAIFVQASGGTVGSDREQFVPDPPVDMIDGPLPTPVDGDDGPGSMDPDAFRVKQGCATTEVRPDAWPLFFVAVAFAIRRRRR